MLGLRSPWTWALVAALVLPGQGCLLDTGPYAGATNASSSGAAGGGGGEGGGGATTTTTTAAPFCGDGNKDPNEECDDGNATEGDGCNECVLDCGCPGCVAGEPCPDCEDIQSAVILKDPESKRCYLFVPALRAHGDARKACQERGGDLVAPSTQEEITLLVDPGFVAAFVPGADPFLVWTGGKFGSTWEWQNGETWNEPPLGPEWQTANPNGTPGTDCVVIDSEGKIRDRSCSEGFPFMCERAPR